MMFTHLRCLRRPVKPARVLACLAAEEASSAPPPEDDGTPPPLKRSGLGSLVLGLADNLKPSFDTGALLSPASTRRSSPASSDPGRLSVGSTYSMTSTMMSSGSDEYAYRPYGKLYGGGTNRRGGRSPRGARRAAFVPRSRRRLTYESITHVAFVMRAERLLVARFAPSMLRLY